MFNFKDFHKGNRLRLFYPILAGATLRERILACLGALFGIALTGLICGAMFGAGPHLPLIVAPMGASAVLLFAVPTSPLAQPWPIIGGNTISALMGVIAGYFIHDPILAIGVGVSLAIGAMSFTRCIHPPGGAAALTAVLGGPAVASWGLLFPFVPVALNSCILVAAGFLFHKLSMRTYPHVALPRAVNTHLTADPPSSNLSRFLPEDIDAALSVLDETFDIDRNDLANLLRQAEIQATIRHIAPVACRDVMSRDVIVVRKDAAVAEAQRLLIKHNIRILPVIDDDGRLIGSVGLRELWAASEPLSSLLASIKTVTEDEPAMSLLPTLTDRRSHAVIVVNESYRVAGLISQTDLLSLVARCLS